MMLSGDEFYDDDVTSGPSHWDRIDAMRGEYDSDYDRIVCEHCDWFDTGGPTSCSWAYHDHLTANHPTTESEGS